MSETANDFIDIDEAVEITRLGRDLLAQMRFRGEGPIYYKPTPKKVLYRRSELIAWLNSTAQHPKEK